MDDRIEGKRLDRLVPVRESVRKTVPFAHQRVEERREALSVGIEVRVQQSRVLAAEAFEHEDHDVARPERGRVGLRIVIGGVERVERFGIEETGIAQRAVSERAQQAERVAQNQVRLAVRRGVERRVAQRDRRVWRLNPPRMPPSVRATPAASMPRLARKYRQPPRCAVAKRIRR